MKKFDYKNLIVKGGDFNGCKIIDIPSEELKDIAQFHPDSITRVAATHELCDRTKRFSHFYD